jgi:hypothetical protein
MPSGTAADVMSVVLAAVGYCHHPASVTVAPTVNNGDPSVVFETRAVVKDQDGQPLLDGNGNPQTVSAAGFNEGDAVIVRGHVTDPALGVPTETFCQSQIAWGDGTVQPLNVNPNDGAFEAKHVYRDDNPTATPSDTYTITVTATDDDGGVTTQTRTVTVNNVEPTVTIDRIEVRDAVLSTNPVTGVSTYLNPGQLDESEGFKIFGTVTDAGVLDKQTVTLRMDLNFDRDTDDPGETSGPITPDPDGPGRWKFEYTVAEVVDDGGTYDADGNRVWGNETESDDITIHAEVVDDDAGTGSGQSTAIVYNVAPAFLGEPFLTFGYDDDANPTSVTVHGDFSDRGSQDMHELYITWGDGKYGDGSTPTNQPIPVQDGAFEVTRLFSVGEVDEESDVYPVLLRLKDDDTGQATKTLESCGCGACTAEPASNTAEQPNPAASSPATVPAASSPVDDNAFWTTNTGRLLKDRIKDALVALKGTIDCLLTADPMRPDHNELMFIRDNIGTVSVTPDGSLSGGPQATPTPTVDDSTSPKKLTKLEIHLRVANLFNASCTPSADEIPVTIPLLGHMRMDKTSMNALNGNMYALAQGNEDDLRTAGQKKPTTEMWDEMQIAALIANELLRGMKACGLYAYEEEFAPAMTPRLLFPGGNQVWDFFRSLPANRQYTRPTAPDAIMHEIYYSGCG